MTTLPSYLRTRWPILLLLSAAAGIIVAAGLAYYQFQSAQISVHIRNELETVSKLKIGQITAWRRERLGNADLIAKNDLGLSAAQCIESGDSGNATVDQARQWLNAVKNDYDYQSAMIVDRSGAILLSTATPGQPRDYIDTGVVRSVLQSRKVAFVDFYQCPTNGDVHLDLVAPLLGLKKPEQQPRFAVIARVDPRTYLYPLIQSWPTPRKSAETLLLRRNGNKAVFLNELRHRSRTALSLEFSLDSTTMPAVRAALGLEGFATGRDYRGKTVFSVIGPVPATPWFMVAKIDREEVLAPLRQQAWTTAIIAGLLISTLFALFGVWWRTRSQRMLHQKLEADLALHASEKQYRSLFDNMLEGLAYCQMIFDGDTPVDFIYLNVNSSFEKLTGLKDVEGKLVTAVIPGIRESDPMLFELYGRVALTGKAERIEIWVEALKTWFHVSVYSPRSGYFIAVFDVITERKRSQQAVETLNRALEGKNKELEQLIYVTSHDLRSPLVNIQGFVKELDSSISELYGILSRCTVPPENRQRFSSIFKDDIPEAVSYIQTSTRTIDTLLAGLLRLARLGRSSFLISPIDMNEVAARAAAGVEYKAKQAGAEISIGKLPRCMGDAMQIGQVLANLLDNAVKYLDPGRKGQIAISGSSADGMATFCIEDNGIGIAPEHQQKIFEIFHRLDPSKTEGEGLGLTIARRILDRLGGKIVVESAKGTGTKFSFSLPATMEKPGYGAR